MFGFGSFFSLLFLGAVAFQFLHDLFLFTGSCVLLLFSCCCVFLPVVVSQFLLFFCVLFLFAVLVDGADLLLFLFPCLWRVVLVFDFVSVLCVLHVRVVCVLAFLVMAFVLARGGVRDVFVLCVCLC